MDYMEDILRSEGKDKIENFQKTLKFFEEINEDDFNKELLDEVIQINYFTTIQKLIKEVRKKQNF